MTLEAIGVDFLWRRIAPLQRRIRLAWEYKNGGNTTQLRPDLAINFAVLEHDYVIRKIFNKGRTHKLSDMVLPCAITSRGTPFWQ